MFFAQPRIASPAKRTPIRFTSLEALHLPFIAGRNRRTGRPVIIANALHTASIMGFPEAESEALLADLFAVLYDESNLYEHHWSVGDLIVWDNIALHHARGNLGTDEPRTLQRVTVGEYTPSELIPGLGELLVEKHAAR